MTTTSIMEPDPVLPDPQMPTLAQMIYGSSRLCVQLAEEGAGRDAVLFAYRVAVDTIALAELRISRDLAASDASAEIPAGLKIAFREEIARSRGFLQIASTALDTILQNMGFFSAVGSA